MGWLYFHPAPPPPLLSYLPLIPCAADVINIKSLHHLPPVHLPHLHSSWHLVVRSQETWATTEGFTLKLALGGRAWQREREQKQRDSLTGFHSALSLLITPPDIIHLLWEFVLRSRTNTLANPLSWRSDTEQDIAHTHMNTHTHARTRAWMYIHPLIFPSRPHPALFEQNYLYDRLTSRHVAKWKHCSSSAGMLIISWKKDYSSSVIKQHVSHDTWSWQAAHAIFM